MSDTWATEFGKLSKQKPVSIITLLPIQHGLSGGITRIGTLGSLLGACLMGMLIWYALSMPSLIIYGIILSGFMAALIDSMLGATVQGKYETQTGEIIESDIVWYHNHLRSYRNRYLLETGAANPSARTLFTPEKEIGEMIAKVTQQRENRIKQILK